jgi:DNA-binding transcriptional ArsR family regulator
MATKKQPVKKPATVDLWQLIEEAWNASAPEVAKARRSPSEDNLEELTEALDEMIPVLRARLKELGKDALLAVDRQLEAALYQIDRQEIQQATDGSDDGFLYARGFIVAMGRRYFEGVDEDPSKALSDAECEEMCYLPWHLYKEKYGEPPKSEISRESCSNSDAW